MNGWCFAAVIVLQGATVGDLMRAIQRAVSKQLTQAGRTKRIGWYVQSFDNHLSKSQFKLLQTE